MVGRTSTEAVELKPRRADGQQRCSCRRNTSWTKNLFHGATTPSRSNRLGSWMMRSDLWIYLIWVSAPSSPSSVWWLNGPGGMRLKQRKIRRVDRRQGRGSLRQRAHRTRCNGTTGKRGPSSRGGAANVYPPVSFVCMSVRTMSVSVWQVTLRGGVGHSPPSAVLDIKSLGLRFVAELPVYGGYRSGPARLGSIPIAGRRARKTAQSIFGGKAIAYDDPCLGSSVIHFPSGSRTGIPSVGLGRRASEPSASRPGLYGCRRHTYTCFLSYQ